MKVLLSITIILLQQLLLSRCTPSAQEVVKVKQVKYLGWSEAVEISNGLVRVVVVPAIGRIMHYSFSEDINVLMTDSAFHGQYLPGDGPAMVDDQATWLTFGGDRIWPTEEGLFKEVNGYKRPPDHFIDGLPWQYRLLAHGVEIESQVSLFCGAKVQRKITLTPGSTQVKIEQYMMKVKKGLREGLEPIPLTIWNISKIKLPSQTFFPLHDENEILIPQWDDSRNYAHENLEIDGTVGILYPDPDSRSQKVGVGAHGWLAGITSDNKVMMEFFEYDDKAIYPDGGTSIAIYMRDFGELECLSPLKALEVGEDLKHTIYWDLKKLTAVTLDQQREEAINWIEGVLE
ncbi:MAG: hypothetical protein KI790_10090 [Cyclobacteriaceae bacterium]|nr:hypothetical protein [Cyclobacteriaceae bacterium HetDA_MAG_MS6]